jgi:hypothetical protein
LNFGDYKNRAENACLFRGGRILVRDPYVPSHRRILQKAVQLSTFMLALDKWLNKISERGRQLLGDVDLNNQEGLGLLFSMSSPFLGRDHNLCVIVRILPHAVVRTVLEVVRLTAVSQGDDALFKSL